MSEKRSLTRDEIEAAPWHQNRQAERPLARDRDHWLKQPYESGPAWHAFRTYRDMGPERSLRKLRTRLNKSEGLFKRWSVRWQWVARVEAWDADQERVVREEFLKRRREAVEMDLKVGEGMVVKAASNLVALPDTGLGAADVVRLAKDGVWIKRTALGLPLGGQRIEGPDHHALKTGVDNVEALGVSQVLQLMGDPGDGLLEPGVPLLIGRPSRKGLVHSWCFAELVSCAVERVD